MSQQGAMPRNDRKRSKRVKPREKIILSVAIAVIKNAPRLSTFRKCPCKEVSLVRLLSDWKVHKLTCEHQRKKKGVRIE
jgi:hypothetical protein